MDVYKNLRKQMYSLREKRIVVGHETTVSLANVQFVVYESGRQRVLRDKQKNVHAFVKGTVVEFVEKPASAIRVSYNPYKSGTFYRCDNNEPVTEAALVYLDEQGIWLIS